MTSIGFLMSPLTCGHIVFDSCDVTKGKSLKKKRLTEVIYESLISDCVTQTLFFNFSFLEVVENCSNNNNNNHNNTTTKNGFEERPVIQTNYEGVDKVKNVLREGANCLRVCKFLHIM